jgi:hypothetical protein
MSCNNVQILNFNHSIVVQSGNNTLVITDKVKCNSVTIPQPVTKILQINSPGPQGPPGQPNGNFTGTFSGSFTGSLIGTSSYATTASYASYATTAQNGFPYSGSAVITGSLIISGSGITIDIPTKGYGLSLVSDANGNATWQPIGSAQGFPYVGNAAITGSLDIGGSYLGRSGMTVTGSVDITQGTFNVDGVNVLDTALAYAIALG